MSRYFFHIQDGDERLDREGIDLLDFAAARREATVLLGRLLLEDNVTLADDADVGVTVTDQDGLMLLTLTVLCQQSMAICG